MADVPTTGVSCGPLQRSLLGDVPPRVDAAFRGATRHDLTHDAWVDVVPGWLDGADGVFDALLADVPWEHHDVRMYDRVLAQPRLTARWDLAEGPLEPPGLGSLLHEAAAALGRRYDVAFRYVGANLYRDGADSVAWHGDRVARELPEATVAVLSLGTPRPFRLRPKGGGTSTPFLPGPGDLLVMGGSCQRTWQHSVPKVRDAGPRISLTFRHAYA